MRRDPFRPPPAAVEPEAGGADEPTRAHQALWFALAQRHLVSVVLVPIEADQSVGRLAGALARVGQRLGDSPVTAIVGDQVDYDFVARASDIIAMTGKAPRKRPGASPLEVIVAVQSVTVEPLGLAVIQAAAAAVLCVRMGRSRISEAGKAVELIGREKISGWVIVD